MGAARDLFGLSAEKPHVRVLPRTAETLNARFYAQEALDYWRGKGLNKQQMLEGIKILCTEEDARALLDREVVEILADAYLRLGKGT